ncbi:hypothetical protein Hden_1242 [Hyphomicrobium denitrificans ATCC 51888]|uniref:Uncharacterized protein n=1 Tax=Hyphomicrobium denitrificans (strain ATCC 51888 / DSM 1869 / NCIMB 11706 / TK 0415) TaxID=582899 RepID=D8JWE1_HYPDA|nr:hypothetical protein [Hyphomicrobium denitrificans]ADJ23054.1 hypothetical protein Hden_1242 [Hyphomicrobium denitrificans ATCC 51888]
MWTALALLFGRLKTRAAQIGGGAIGAAVLVVLAIVLVIVSIVWLKNVIVDGAISGRDLAWTKTLTAATDKARNEEAAKRAERERAANAERDRARAEAVAAVDQVRELEQELAALKDNPVCYTPEITRILRK